MKGSLLSKRILAICIFSLFTRKSYSQIKDTLAYFSFAQTYAPTASKKPDIYTADGGINSAVSHFSSNFSGGAGTISARTPTGETIRQLRISGWEQTDVVNNETFLQVSTSSIGYEKLIFKFLFNPSSSGAKDFDLYYSVDSTTYVLLDNTSIRPTVTGLAEYTFDLSTTSVGNSLDNKSKIYFKLRQASLIKISGTPPNGNGFITRFTVLGEKTAESSTPTTFNSISAKKNANGINVLWNSGVESNVRLFTLSKREDGSHWGVIDSVLAKGNNSSYTILDKHPIDGINYYRIASYDFDGVVSFSEVVKIEYSNSPNSSIIKFSPNPLTSGSSLYIAGESISYYTLEIYDISGRLFYTRIVRLPTTLSDLKLLPGIYIVRAINQTNKKDIAVEKILVR